VIGDSEAGNYESQGMEKRIIKSFEDLECWKAARELGEFVVTKILPALPKDEKYRLADQMLRAARSITANIAEGYGRFHYLDSSKFLSNARGSAYELLDHLITAEAEKLIPTGLLQDGRELVDRAVRLLNGYLRYLKGKASGL